MMKLKLGFPSRLNRFWEVNLTGGDVLMIMTNILPILDKIKNVNVLKNTLIEKLEILLSSTFYSFRGIQSVGELVEFVFIKFFDMYFALRELRSNSDIEKEIERSVIEFRELIFYGSLQNIFDVPKNHFLQELCADRILHGPCHFFETSSFESTHHIHRDSASSKNKRFIYPNIILRHLSRMLVMHLYDGGLLFENETVTEGLIFTIF